jgi:membrane-bound inhibitor of C-type lysozyme
MIRLTTGIAAIIATALLTACGGGGWWPFGGKSEDPSTRIPPGATVYNCAGNKRLFVRHTADGKSAWVIYPDREFRLDRATAASGDRYSNGVSTLTVQGEETTLEEGGARLFTDCKRS